MTSVQTNRPESREQTQPPGIFPTPEPLRPLPWTGERLVPGLGGPIEFEHYHRYLFARQLCRGKDVLDIASGEGYGSALLAQVARSVVGVDISRDAVEHATAAYLRGNLSFRCGGATELPLEDASVDAVVSFETIEHFVEHEAFLNELKRVLRPGGFVIVSTPDAAVYSGAGAQPNPYHRKELTRMDFVRLIEQHFRHCGFYEQNAMAGSAIVPERKGNTLGPWIFGRRQEGFQFAERLPKATYIIAIASDAALPEAGLSLYVGGDASSQHAQDLGAQGPQAASAPDDPVGE